MRAVVDSGFTLGILSLGVDLLFDRARSGWRESRTASGRQRARRGGARAGAATTSWRLPLAGVVRADDSPARGAAQREGIASRGQVSGHRQAKTQL